MNSAYSAWKFQQDLSGAYTQHSLERRHVPIWQLENSDEKFARQKLLAFLEGAEADFRSSSHWIHIWVVYTGALV